MSSGPVAEYESLLASADFLFVVYYRGHWCPFCVAYLKDLTAVAPAIKAAHGETVIVTAEAAEHLPAMRKSTGYVGPAINDPENTLAKELKTRGLLDVAFSAKGGYPHDMAQPAVLVITKEGKVLEKWAIVPGAMNLGGAKDRPILKEVWANAEAKLHGNAVVHQSYNKQAVTSVLWGKIFG